MLVCSHSVLIVASVHVCCWQLVNIAFIKTHKTASTTLASIFYRYGKRHDSNIAKFQAGGTVVDLDLAANQARNTQSVRCHVVRKESSCKMRLVSSSGVQVY